MAVTRNLETRTVAEVQALDLPELEDFQIIPLDGSIDLEQDQIPWSCPTLAIAVTGASPDGRAKGADRINVAFVAAVPGQDQAVRRQDAMDALFVLRDWMGDSANPWNFDGVTTLALHPFPVIALYAYIVS